MNNSDRYRRAFNTYYDKALKEHDILPGKVMEKKSTKRIVNRWAIGIASFLLLLSGTTLVVGAATGLFDLAGIFRNDFEDPISAQLVEAGKVQELDITSENEEYQLKLVAFTGDEETHIAMFELTPKVDFGDVSRIVMYGQAFSPSVLEEKTFYSYRTSKIEGSYDREKNVYYFSYKLPPYWASDTEEDLVIRIRGVEIFRKDKLSKYIHSVMIYQFTPDRSILEESVKIPINQLVSKTVYQELVAFTDNYDNPHFYRGEIIAPTTEATIIITEAIISKYSTEIKAFIEDESIGRGTANSYWNQFTEERFLVNHYYNGVENKNAYEIACVENTERFRLFVDGVELKVNEESLKYLPGREHDAEGNEKKEGKFGCAIKFEGFDYNAAESVELHLGKQVLKLK